MSSRLVSSRLVSSRLVSSRALAALGLVSLVCLAACPVRAAAPGSIEVTCDVDRTQFRNAARPLSPSTNVTFRLWTDQTPGAPDTQVGPDYTVPLSALAVFKRHTDRYDGVKPRRTVRINAVIGSDASPVLLPADGVAWMDLTVGTTTIGCDFAEGASATARRRLQSVAFAREADHSETCTTAGSIPDISARVANSGNISVPNGEDTALTFDSERWDTDNIHSLSADTSRLTATSPGKYLIFGKATLDGSTGIRRLGIRLGGGGFFIAFQTIDANAAPQANGLSVVSHWPLSEGDYVELVAFQNSGASVNAIGHEFGMVKVP